MGNTVVGLVALLALIKMRAATLFDREQGQQSWPRETLVFTRSSQFRQLDAAVGVYHIHDDTREEERKRLHKYECQQLQNVSVRQKERVCDNRIAII